MLIIELFELRMLFIFLENYKRLNIVRSLVFREVIRYNLGPNRVITKDVKSHIYTCYINSKRIVVEIPWPKTGATH